MPSAPSPRAASITPTSPAQSWDAAGYDKNARFVSDLGAPVVKLLGPRADEAILDLGCGDGALTQKIAATGARVTGIDTCPDFLEAARARGLNVRALDAQKLDYEAEFDAVFTNAALHWMRDIDAVLAGVARAMKPSTRFVGEFGGKGNIAAITATLIAVLKQHGVDGAAQFAKKYYPTTEEFSEKLRAHGFTIMICDLIPRPTPLPESGMQGWLSTFANFYVTELDSERKKAVFDEVTEILRPILCDSKGRWTADYIRLRFKAVKNA
jgi:trans-aconitate methyltransferase